MRKTRKAMRIAVAGAAVGGVALVPVNAGAVWSAPQTVCTDCSEADGLVSFAEAPNGAAVAAWHGNRSTVAAYRGPGDDEFGRPFTIATGGKPQFIRAAIGPDGTAAVATWLPNAANSQVIARRRPNQTNWTTVPAPEGATNAQVTVGPDGTVVTSIVSGGPSLRVYMLPANSTTFSGPTTVYTQAAGTTFQPPITLAGNGLGTYALGWSVFPTGGTTFQYQASVSSDGTTWSAPQVVDTSVTTGGSVSVDPLGDALVTYSGGAAGGTPTVVSRSFLDNMWRNPTQIPIGPPNALGYDAVGNTAMIASGGTGVPHYFTRSFQNGQFTSPQVQTGTASAGLAVAPGGDTLVITQNTNKTSMTSSWGSTLTGSTLGNTEQLPGSGTRWLIGVGLDQNSLGTAVWSSGSGPTSGDVLASTRPAGSGGDVALTTGQLLTNQRISQAAVLRSNGALDALNGGLPAPAFRNAAFGPPAFGTGVPITGTATPAAPSNALGYTVPIPSKSGGGGTVQLTQQQLLINQRISQAAVLRSNAVRDRLQQGLTASQIGTGAITSAKLRPGLGYGTPGPNASGTPIVVPSANKNGGSVSLTQQQLLINQRISQAAVRRSNLNVAELQSGLTLQSIASGGIASQNISP